MKRLAIVTTHPIQYYAPLFRLLSKGNSIFSVKVFYTLSQAQNKLHDPDFGLSFEWDIPLLDGYSYTFVKNVSNKPGTRSFRGIENPTLNSEIEAWQPNAILVFGWAFVSHLKALRYFHGKIPVLFRGDSNLIDEPAGFSLKKLLRRTFLRWVYSHVDYALYVGEANRQYYVTHGLQMNQLFFAPHSIDNTRFTTNVADAESRARVWRANLGIEASHCVFLFAGKLTPKKDPELLIKAFLALQQSRAKLIIIGNGELEDELKTRYIDSPDVRFIPFQNQSIMPVVYRLCDVFVLPSKGPGETWGLSVNEAMACGRSIIVSKKCGCAADLVHSGKNGYVFESGNMEDLTKGMLLSSSHYREYGASSLEIIQDWTYSHTYNQLVDMVKKKLC